MMLAESKYTVAISLRVTVIHIACDAPTKVSTKKHKNRFIHPQEKCW
jgi:hypothetical protein